MSDLLTEEELVRIAYDPTNVKYSTRDLLDQAVLLLKKRLTAEGRLSP